MEPKEEPKIKVTRSLKKDLTKENPFFPFLLLLSKYQETKKKLEEEGTKDYLIGMKSDPILIEAFRKMMPTLLHSILDRDAEKVLLSKITEKLAGHDFVANPPSEEKVFQAIVDGLASVRDLKNNQLTD